MKTINIGLEFSRTPMGRVLADSNSNGELFRDTVLVPALREHDKVEIILDDTEGYGSSFLDEAFGGVVRNGYFTEAQLKEKMSLKWAKKRHFGIYARAIWAYINDEELRRVPNNAQKKVAVVV